MDLAGTRQGRPFSSRERRGELRSQDYATVGVRDALANALSNETLAELGWQGDEPNEPFDVLRVRQLTPIPGKLHPYFKELAGPAAPGRAPGHAPW